MASIKVPGQDDKNDPPRASAMEDWGSLNTKARRPAIQPTEFSWIENLMPIGHGNMRTLYAEGAAVYTAPGGRTIILHFPYNLGAVSYEAVFLDNGSAVQVRTSDGAMTTIGAAGTFWGAGETLPACSQYESKYLLIGSAHSANSYWAWDGVSLYGAGTLAPQVVITNGGSAYTSAPTVTAFRGSGSGATFSATVSGGSVSLVNVTAPGSGYLLGEQVQVIFSGGGSDTQARVHATVDSSKGGVAEVQVTAGGTGYSSDVHITFAGGGGTGAAAVVSTAINGVVVAITVTNPGSAYTSAPTVTITGTTGAGATAIANVVRGQITGFVIDNAGTGYDGAPQVVITAPDDTTFPTIHAVGIATVAAGVVSSVTVINAGAGYINAGVEMTGGNNAANALVTLMPFGLKASSIETYESIVWTALETKQTESAPGSVSDFSTAAGGGSVPATDSFLRNRIVALKQANGFLYRFGDSSINVISNVQTSSTATTTFNNANVDAQIGTAWRDTVVAFGRAILFANPNGVYALYGGAAEKVSDALDGLFAQASFNLGTSGVTPTASVATVFGIRTYCFLFTTTDAFTKTSRNIVAMWNGDKWWIATQLATLTLVAPEEINSVLTSWGCDGTHLFRMFQTPSENLTKTFQTKLDAGGGYHLYKQANRGYIVAENNASEAAVITASIDSDTAAGIVNTVTITGTMTFVGSGPITFVGAGPISFNVAALQVQGFQTSAYGRMLGWTVQTNAEDLTYLSIMRLERDYALYG